MEDRMNVLLITLDDMNYNSHDFLLDHKDQLTPHMDALAGDSLVFQHSHVTVALCQPSRSCLMTGRYPHRNGARGFESIRPDVEPLSSILHKEGYLTAIIGKETHLAPKEQFVWDHYIRTYREEDDYGRNPESYYHHCRRVIEDAAGQAKPFFMMANIHDPHRPFAGSEDELEFFGRHIATRQQYLPDEVKAPGFLPDLAEIREEIAQYLSSVHRADESVGEVLRALKEAGQYDRTIVVLLSDNGMAFPFAKANCYLNSSKSPFTVRVPGLSGKKKSKALISGIDYMPTILDLLDLPVPEGLDGRSFASILEGELDEHDPDVYTLFFKTAKNPTTGRERHYPMRCVQDRQFAYIYNAWSDGKTDYLTESMSGMTFKAMKEHSGNDPRIADRVKMLQKRVPEELYDLEADPDALQNLFGVAAYKDRLTHYRKRMEAYMTRSEDDLLEDYKKHLTREEP